MPRIAAIHPDSATGETAELFEQARQTMGGVPNVLRVLGNSPPASWIERRGSATC